MPREIPVICSLYECTPISWIPWVSDLMEHVNEGGLVGELKRSVRVGRGPGRRGTQALLIHWEIFYVSFTSTSPQRDAREVARPSRTESTRYFSVAHGYWRSPR